VGLVEEVFAQDAVFPCELLDLLFLEEVAVAFVLDFPREVFVVGLDGVDEAQDDTPDLLAVLEEKDKEDDSQKQEQKKAGFHLGNGS
jgi:hypothetical protein